ncbi:MAG: GTP 3',8-cyclase MoaA [Desulfuromonas sp.]|nr:MAG: GTP 3',8-cyclase MoaA [Desulfuromonas sp.]
MKLIDRYGRKINYLRLSVTDRCNMRCQYCMPAHGVDKITHDDVLSYEDLYRISKAAVAIGIEKIRVTGGEPLVRKGIVPFLERLSSISGLKQLVLTTNGLMLDEMALDLKNAGVKHLNVSLDSLNAKTFAEITRGANLFKVLAGLAAAERVGLPIKINVVTMRGVNDHEIEQFAELTRDKSLAVRFIEYMPSLKKPGWQKLSVSGNEVLERLGQKYSLEAVDRQELAGPACEYRIPGAKGTIGVITPMTGHFCSSCNRIRVTSTGQARSCLFSDMGMNLKSVLASEDPLALQGALRHVVELKPDMHGVSADRDNHDAFAMSNIGG